ncbi:MAG TPA: radical SAM family heme chaperone HemW [Terriglobia bacterium]|nr:radical SAM family heme chaperone HemW [Terriglobia bacterium]
MENLGVYIQVPFCPSKCSFCNFSSRVAPARLIDDYWQALRKEIDGLPDFLSQQGIPSNVLELPVDTIYLGGGTPPLLGAATLVHLIERLRGRFKLAHLKEFTIEATPGSADLDFLLRIHDAGVTRLSIGAQSFIDKELRVVGRLHNAGQTRLQVAIARQAGFENIGLDLIGGLPHQTQESWEESLQQAVKLRPEHISVYLFEIDEKSRLGGEVLQHGDRYHAAQVPSDDFMAEAYERAREFLIAQGYRQYEISNFALPGRESIHNRKYWQLQPYLGLGAGAHSFDGAHRWSNELRAEAYIQKINHLQSPVAESHALTREEQLEEYFFLGLRQCEGVTLPPPFDRRLELQGGDWRLKIERLLAEGLLEKQGESIRLESHAYLISNEVFQEFLA